MDSLALLVGFNGVLSVLPLDRVLGQPGPENSLHSHECKVVPLSMGLAVSAGQDCQVLVFQVDTRQVLGRLVIPSVPVDVLSLGGLCFCIVLPGSVTYYMIHQ